MRQFSRLQPIASYGGDLLSKNSHILAFYLAGKILFAILAGGIVAVGPSVAGVGGGGMAGGGTITSLAARQLAAEAIKQAAQAAGVVLVMGTVARADTTAIEFSRFDIVGQCLDWLTPFQGTNRGGRTAWPSQTHRTSYLPLLRKLPWATL